MKSDDAERLGRSLLEPLGDRWRHTEGVADAAASPTMSLGPVDGDALVAAAWVHDIGYAPALVVSGFHPLDGARWLRQRGEARLSGLVAHHTGAHAEAALQGLGTDLAEFADEQSEVSAALAYCDLTTGPQGQRMTPEERLAEIVERHGQDSVVVAGLRAAWPSLLAMVAKVERELLSTDHPR